MAQRPRAKALSVSLYGSALDMHGHSGAYPRVVEKNKSEKNKIGVGGVISLFGRAIKERCGRVKNS